MRQNKFLFPYVGDVRSFIPAVKEETMTNISLDSMVVGIVVGQSDLLWVELISLVTILGKLL